MHVCISYVCRVPTHRYPRGLNPHSLTGSRLCGSAARARLSWFLRSGPHVAACKCWPGCMSSGGSGEESMFLLVQVAGQIQFLAA